MPKVATKPGIGRLGAMRKFEPAVFVKVIREVMEAAGGRVPDAAAELTRIYGDVSTRQLFRWLEDPRLGDIPRAPVGRWRDGTKRKSSK